MPCRIRAECITDMRRITKYTIMLFAGMAAFCSCSKEDQPGKNEDGPKEGYTIVEIPSDRKTFYKNPLSGWVIYVPVKVDQDDHFWEVYDNMDAADGKVNVSDFATVLYIRGTWTDFNPEKNVYIWQEGVDTPQAKRLKMLREGAEKRGLKLAFTLRVDSRDRHEFCSPPYLLDEGMGVFWTKTGSMDVWSPYPDDPVFQQWYGEFIRQFAKEFNDPKTTMFISGLGMGKWGEYHSCVYSTGDATPRRQVFDWVTSLYAEAFDKIPVVTNCHRWVGTTGGWTNENDYDPESDAMLRSAIAKGFSMRHDAFGMHPYYSDWEKNFLLSVRYQVPILSEGGWIVTTHSYWNDTEGYRKGHPEDVRNGEFKDAMEACANMMDFRYMDETKSWFNDARELVDRFLREGCYRIYPDRISLPEKCRLGEEISIGHRWVNLGKAYCPTNIKQWEGRYKVAFALLDPVSLKPVKLLFDENAHPHEWTKGRKSYAFNTKVEGIKPGKYVWAVGITDSLYDNAIGIQLAAKSAFTPDNWLKLSDVEITE